MDKYLTFPGLQPVYLGDVDFLQESVSKALLQLLKGLTGEDRPRCLLKEATPESDGAICFDGEILPLKYGEITDKSIYKIKSTYSGSRVFQNTDKHDCYEIRYAVVVDGDSSSADHVTNFPLLQSIILNSAVAQERYEFDYEGSSFISKIVVTKIGSVYTLTGTFQQIDIDSNVVAAFRLDLPLDSDVIFHASAKLSDGQYVLRPLRLSGGYLPGVGPKYIQIFLASSNLDDVRIANGYFSLILQ